MIKARLKKLKTYIAYRGYRFYFFVLAHLEYWFAPWGRSGGLRARLKELPARCDPGELGQPQRLAIFVGFSPTLTLSNRAYLETLNRANYAIVYISNCSLQASACDAIGQLAWRLFERRNLGRDVGAFRDGVLWLEQQGLLDHCQALMIVNDSMQFIPGKNAEALIRELHAFESSSDLGLFSHVSQDHNTHYQSYFQVLKRPIFCSPKFLRFWHDYLPLSHRNHCIFKGEIALSAQVYRSFPHVRALYTSEALQRVLERKYDAEGGVDAAEILRLIPSPARTVQRNAVGFSLNQILAMSKKASMAKWYLYCIADLIEHNNPSHLAAFLFPKYLGCPLVKQDLCSAGSYTIAQALSLFREALVESSCGCPEDIDIDAHVNEFAQVLYRKGTPMSHMSSPRDWALKGITGGFVYGATYDGNI